MPSKPETEKGNSDSNDRKKLESNFAEIRKSYIDDLLFYGDEEVVNVAQLLHEIRQAYHDQSPTTVDEGIIAKMLMDLNNLILEYQDQAKTDPSSVFAAQAEFIKLLKNYIALTFQFSPRRKYHAQQFMSQLAGNFSRFLEEAEAQTRGGRDAYLTHVGANPEYHQYKLNFLERIRLSKKWLYNLSLATSEAMLAFKRVIKTSFVDNPFVSLKEIEYFAEDMTSVFVDEITSCLNELLRQIRIRLEEEEDVVLTPTLVQQYEEQGSSLSNS